MSGQQSQQLLGYLLGALEEDEQQQIEAQLRRDPALRAELARLRQCLEPLEESWQPVCPPSGLWQRTCHFVDVAARAVAVVPGELARRSSWAFRDLAAVAAVVVAGCLLLFPAVNRSRFQAAMRGCQNNLWQLGVSLKQYADINNGCFPLVPQQGPGAFGGFFAPELRDHGLLPDTRVMVCPAAGLQRRESLYVPTCQELRSATPQQLAELRRRMRGDYGYTLGCMVNGRYVPVRDRNRPTYALIADAPSPALDGQPSGNHGWQGQNILFEDCTVRFFSWEDLTHGCVLLYGNAFLNNDGEVGPGQDEADAVIVPMCARPLAWGQQPEEPGQRP
jgi:hypothetical protein